MSHSEEQRVEQGKDEYQVEVFNNPHSKRDHIMTIIQKDETKQPLDQEIFGITNNEIAKINTSVANKMLQQSEEGSEFSSDKLLIGHPLDLDLQQVIKAELQLLNKGLISEIHSGNLKINEKEELRDHILIDADGLQMLNKNEEKIQLHLMRNAMTVTYSPNHEKKMKQSPRQISPQKEQIAEAKQFIQSLRKESKKRQMKMETLNKSMVEKQKLQEDEFYKEIEMHKTEKLKAKEELVQEKIHQIQRRKEERERNHQEWVIKMKQMKQEQPYFMKIEEDYEKKFVLPQINQEKNALNQIKETMSHRIDLHEIREHNMRYQEKMKIIELKKYEQKKASLQQSPSQVTSKLPISHFYESVTEEESKRKQDQRDKVDKIKQLKQKKELYDKFVKEMHPANVSSDKSNQLQLMIDGLKHPVKQRKENYDNFLIQKDSSSAPVAKEKHRRNKSEAFYSVSQSTLDEPKKVKKIDYLPEMREKNAGKSAVRGDDWEKHLTNKNLSQQEKIDLIRIRSEAMERKANFKEIGVKQQADSGQKEVNQLYLDSIKVKMALLEQM